MPTTLITRPETEAWLRSHGLSTNEIAKVVAGIDWKEPVMLTTLPAGDRVVQFRDRPSASYPSGDLGGQWFGLQSVRSQDIGNLGIGSGLAGRQRHELMVLRDVEVLESTARSMPRLIWLALAPAVMFLRPSLKIASA